MNNDLISRSALKKAICIDEAINADETWEQLYDAVVKAIDNAPTVETKECPYECDTCAHKMVCEILSENGKCEYPLHKEAYQTGYEDGLNARPQGEWIDHSETDGYVECPFCGSLTTCWRNKAVEELHYCFNCGAELGKGGAE